MTDLSLLDATAQAELVRTGNASAAEFVDSAIERVEKVNGELNAVIHPLFDRARAAVGNGLPAGPFTGVPIVIKDLDGTLAGAPYHAGNKALKEAKYVATTTSYIFEKLEHAGFVIVGKTNTPEFGLMPTTEPQAYGPTHNPWNLAHSSGGSSGGTAAAVASGMVPRRSRRRRWRFDPYPVEHVRPLRLEAHPRSDLARPEGARGVGGPRDAARPDAHRARQRGCARCVAGLHDRRLVHRAGTRRARTQPKSVPRPARCASGYAPARRSGLRPSTPSAWPRSTTRLGCWSRSGTRSSKLVRLRSTTARCSTRS